MLELLDMGKDLLYLYGRPHELKISLAFTLTIIIPFLINVFQTNVLKYRQTGQEKSKWKGKNDEDPDPPSAGKPQEIKEMQLLHITLLTHLGFE